MRRELLSSEWDGCQSPPCVPYVDVLFTSGAGVDALDLEKVCENVARAASVNVSAVSVTADAATSASSRVTITVGARSSMQAISIVDLLSASLSSADAATALIGVPVEGTPSCSITEGDEPEPEPEGGGDASISGAGSPALVFAAAGAGGGVLLLALLFAYCWWRRHRAEKDHGLKKSVEKDPSAPAKKTAARTVSATRDSGSSASAPPAAIPKIKSAGRPLRASGKGRATVEPMTRIV
jgi:hypothetical protein